MDQKELNNILAKHKEWLHDEEGGERANLQGANLRRANLQDADLRRANLQDANLQDADLQDADLQDADLRSANLWRADLWRADLWRANLQDADLRRANLQDADLQDADLRRANLWRADLRRAYHDSSTVFLPIQCPEEGSFIAYKKAKGLVVKLLIPDDAKRSSATSRKCRCDKAKVLEIMQPDKTPSNITSVPSNYDPDFVYEVGKTVMVSDFEEDRFVECAAGIHFFITFDEAKKY
ncbi:pentapeptide repeat-containing protein [Enterococcus avium]|uniref:pentapeptide repeat-containing protein n=1 Tax=Enterococcus avium TaxID=33945 RepID=UPI001C10854E|nr:pentapeptide repeat-containing protein [Enterococcus avium]MBU5368596.1 pentapeptide repeat-containing protein [Enterococcus avium]